jgi:hypothetical protein
MGVGAPKDSFDLARDEYERVATIGIRTIRLGCTSNETGTSTSDARPGLQLRHGIFET